MVAVPSLMAALQARTDGAQERAGRLCDQIAELSGQLSAVEAELSRLRITRETVDEVLADGPGAAGSGDFVDAEAAVAPLAELVPVLLAAQVSGDVTVTSPAYRLILVAFAEAAGPLRCKDVCTAVGLGTEANHTEGMRSKLKRLVDRGILTEAEPGLFALASQAGGGR